jgi:3-carboxy-cis,cis-muconate cycloisomerase
MLDPGFSTEKMARIFTAARRVEAITRFEAALALALADAGLAPAKDAEAVAEACQTLVIDPDMVLASTWSDGTPLTPLLEEIRGRLPEAQAKWVHHGTTTQDAIDTATMLQAGEALDVLDSALLAISSLMAGLVGKHRDQPQFARTFLQHARPTTFGMTVARWLEPTLRHLAELRRMKSGLAVQLGGPVGNLGAYEGHGMAVVEALAARLGLTAPALPWHSDRSRIAALASALERCARTMARVGLNVALLSSSDIAEIKVRSGGSSSMEEKRNPIDSVRAIAAAELATAGAGMITSGRLSELDRGIGGWHAEWVALPLVFQATAATVEAMTTCLGSVEVEAGNMSARVPEGGTIDQALIDGVLAEFERLAGRR